MMNRTDSRPRTRGRRHPLQINDVGGWGRGRLIGVLMAGCVVGLLLVFGLLVGVVNLLHRPGETRAASRQPQAAARPHASSAGPSSATSTGDRVRVRDQIAAAPMLRVPEQAMLAPDDPSAPTSVEAPGIAVPSAMEIPTADDPGAASVLTGYPRTPEGAVGQLGQIETTVLQAMNLDEAHEVYRSWALPGGPGADDWALTRNVSTFLSSAGMGGTKDPGSVVTTEPVGALVKGVDRDDWNVACVLVKVTAVYRQTDQVAYGHCERMQWQVDRWMIAPGSPPAPAPSTWPGSSWATSAGWRSWVSAAGVGSDQ